MLDLIDMVPLIQACPVRLCELATRVDVVTPSLPPIDKKTAPRVGAEQSSNTTLASWRHAVKYFLAGALPAAPQSTRNPAFAPMATALGNAHQQVAAAISSGNLRAYAGQAAEPS